MPMLKTFLELAAIDSLSYEERPAADYVIRYLSSLGLDCHEDGAGAAIGGNCGNLTVVLPGNAPGEPIMFSAHLDTVAPGKGVKPTVKDGYVVSESDTVLGADDKAGVAIILQALKALSTGEHRHADIAAVFTVAEEVGLRGSQAMDLSKVGAGLCFVLDDSGPVGKITTKAPYQDYFECVFTGRAAHAGIEPERGKSAILAAADAVGRMNLGRIDAETTANIGMVSGGTAINVVPGETTIKGEARGHSETRLKEQIEHMSEACRAAGAHAGVACEITVKRLYDGFSLDPEAPVVKKAMEAVRSAGLEPSIGMSGGGSDTNVFNAAGIAAVNLGVGYENVHTIGERIAVESLEQAYKLVMALATGPGE